MQWQGDMELGAVVDSTGSEGGVFGGMVVRATVKAEERATASVEARTTVKAEDSSASNAKVVVRARVKDEERAAVGAKAHGLVHAGGLSAGNASMVDRAHVKVEERATVSTEARTTVNAGDILGGNANTIDRATVSPEDRATVSAEDRATVMTENGARIGNGTTVKAEERASVNVEVRTSFGADDHSVGNANMVDRVAVKVDSHIAVRTKGYSVRNAGAHLPRFGALVRDIGGTREERRAHAQAVASQKWSEISDEKTRRISDELNEIERRLNDYRKKVAAMNRGCADDLGVAGAWIDARFAVRSEVARVLGRTDPEERQRDVSWRNRARRMALLTINRHSRHAAADANNMEIDRVHGRMDAEERPREVSRRNRARSTALGTINRHSRHAAAEANNMEVDREHGRMDPEERQMEIGRSNRAKRMASRAIYRYSRHAAAGANNMTLDREALMYAINARVADGQDQAEARQQEIQQLSGAWAKMDPQQRAREVAKVRRTVRMDARAVQRQQRKALARAMAEESAARDNLNHARHRDRTRAVVAHARADSAEASQNDHGATRAHAHAQTLAETNDKGAGEVEPQVGRAALMDGIGASVVEQPTDGTALADTEGAGEVGQQMDRTARKDCTGAGGVELQMDGTALMGGPAAGEVDLQVDRTALTNGILAGAIELETAQTVQNGVGAGELELSTDLTELMGGTAAGGGMEQLPTDWTRFMDGTDGVEQQTGETALADGKGESEVEQQRTKQTGLTDGIGAGELDRRAAVVDGICVNGFPFVETKIIDDVRSKAVVEGGGRVNRDAVEVKRKVDLAKARDAEKLETDGLSMDGMGDGELGRTAAVVDGEGAGGCPLIQPKLEELREKALVGMGERVDPGAVEANRKADLARTRDAENPRRREDKNDRKASRAAKRIKKLQHRLDKAKRKGEGSRESVEIVKRPGRLERGSVAGGMSGMPAEDNVQREVQADKAGLNDQQAARGFEALAHSHAGPTG